MLMTCCASGGRGHQCDGEPRVDGGAAALRLRPRAPQSSRPAGGTSLLFFNFHACGTLPHRSAYAYWFAAALGAAWPCLASCFKRGNGDVNEATQSLGMSIRHVQAPRLRAAHPSPSLAPVQTVSPGMHVAQAVSRAQHVDTRHQVWKELGILGDTVFPTVAPFIRVRTPRRHPDETLAVVLTLPAIALSVDACLRRCSIRRLHPVQDT